MLRRRSNVYIHDNCGGSGPPPARCFVCLQMLLPNVLSHGLSTKCGHRQMGASRASSASSASKKIGCRISAVRCRVRLILNGSDRSELSLCVGSPNWRFGAGRFFSASSSVLAPVRKVASWCHLLATSASNCALALLAISQ